MSRFCEQCGNKLEVSEKFCPYCGVKVEYDELPYQSSKPESKSKNKNSMMIIGGILIFALLIGIWSMNNKSSESSLGGLALGMSRKEADKKFLFGRPSERGGFFYGNIYVQFTQGNSGIIKYMYCNANDKSVGTGRGVHIGSNYDEVVNAYGTNYSSNGSSLYNRMFYKFRDFDLFFDIDNYTNQVIGIGLYNTKWR